MHDRNSTSEARAGAPFDAARAVAVAGKGETEGDPRGKAARAIFEAGDVRIIAHRPASVGYKDSGSAKGADGHRVRPQLVIDHDGDGLRVTLEGVPLGETLPCASPER